MLIYKFKDLTDEKKYSYFLQIVLYNSIWCSRPDSLNDADEFRFKLDYSPTEDTSNLLAQVVAKYLSMPQVPPEISAAFALKKNTLKNIAGPIIYDFVNKCRTTIGITCFSVMETDKHLWDEYGGKGNGVCIEIDLPDRFVGCNYHQVQYVPEKIFHVDLFLMSSLFPEKAFLLYQNILLTKTRKWAQEEEVRFVGKRQDINLAFDGLIRKVTFGPNVSKTTLDKIMPQIVDHCRNSDIKIFKL